MTRLALALVIAATGVAHASPDDMVAAYLTGGLAGAALDARVAAELAAPTDLAETIRATILVGRVAEARAAFETWRAHGADGVGFRLLALELALLDAPIDGPLDASIRAGCANPDPDAELWCHRFVHWRTPSIRGLRARVLDPVATDLDWLSDAKPTELAVGNAIAHALRITAQRCSRVVERPLVAQITFDSRVVGDSPFFVSVRASDPIAASCVWGVMSLVRLPTHELTPPITTEVALAPIPGHRPERGANAHDTDGALAYLRDRQNVRPGHVLGADAHLELGGGERRLVLGGRLELGNARDGARAYDARAELGFSIHSRTGVELAFTGGVGVSRDGDRVPRHVGIPIDFRLRFPIGSIGGVAWLQFDFDHDLSIGVGARFTILHVNAFVGVAADQHAEGSGTLVVLGLPLGTGY